MMDYEPLCLWSTEMMQTVSFPLNASRSKRYQGGHLLCSTYITYYNRIAITRCFYLSFVFTPFFPFCFLLIDFFCIAIGSFLSRKMVFTLFFSCITVMIAVKYPPEENPVLFFFALKKYEICFLQNAALSCK